MLDAIVAAPEHLVLTYTGANETTGQPRPPAVPLGELLDALDEHRRRAAATTRCSGTRCRPSTGATSTPAPRPFSFDPAALAGARAAGAPAASRRRPGRRRRCRAASGDVDLAELVVVPQEPGQGVPPQRLDVALPDEGDEVPDGLPVELDGLQQWGSATGCCATCSPVAPPSDTLGKEWRRGVLPPGRLGWRLAQQIVEQAAPGRRAADSVRRGRTPRRSTSTSTSAAAAG